VESISGIWKFTIEPGHHIHTASLPGHLLQLVLEGSYAIRTNNREYTVKQGDLIYFYASEDVEWLGNEEKVVFYSVGFRSTAFTPLPLDRRVFPSNRKIRTAFATLYDSKTLGKEDAFKELMMFGALHNVLSEVVKLDVFAESKTAANNAWWDVERSIRKQHMFRPSLDQLAELCQYSRASTVRLCRKATGQSPVKRIQTIRMEEAKALLGFSSLNITEVSKYLCYDRVHEFSREFSAYFDMSPRAFREMNRSS
jgi:AraC-like DNA-binding protein